MIIRGGAPDFSRREQAANWRLLDDASKPFIQAASAFAKSRIILFAFQVIKYSAHRVNCIVTQRKLRTKWGKTSNAVSVKGKGSPCSITERRVPELTPVLGSQPAGDVSHISDGRLPLLSARPAVTLATLKKAATNFAAW